MCEFHCCRVPGDIIHSRLTEDWSATTDPGLPYYVWINFIFAGKLKKQYLNERFNDSSLSVRGKTYQPCHINIYSSPDEMEQLLLP